MGLIKAIGGSAGGVTADQWKEYFYCESLPPDVLISKGQKRTSSRRTSNTKAEPNIITKGSIIAINEGQFAVIVEQGRIIDYSGEAGEFYWDDAGEPSLFSGKDDEKFSKRLSDVFHIMGRRISAGGDTMRDQRVYFFNMKEIYGNKYGTANPIPFRVVDANVGFDVDIAVRCHGEYSYKIDNPLLFYKNVCGNEAREFMREEIDSQMKSELLTALQPAFAEISARGVRYSQVPSYADDLTAILDKELSDKWQDKRGIKIQSFAVSSITASDQDAQMIKNLQRNAAFKDPRMAAAQLTGAQADAMVSAAQNDNAGPVMAFAGLNMANQAGGVNANQLFGMDAAPQQAPTPSAQSDPDAWTCECGSRNTTSFCPECGKPKPAAATTTCPACGWQGAPSKFCPNCGEKLP